MGKEKTPGVWNEDETKRAADKTNVEMSYSRKIEVFKPINIKLLVDLSDIEPTMKEYGENIEKDSVCQMVMTPNGKISVGRFNEQGNGKSYLSVDNAEHFKEGVHFVFE